MKIFSFGAEFFGGQIDRIRLGFEKLGHVNLPKSSEECPDLIYSNDAENYSNAILCYNYFKKNGCNPKLVLNVLDVPSWVLNFHSIKDEWEQVFKIADRITCISETVKRDVKTYFNVDAAVVYNPIKQVYPLGLKKDIFAIFVGRSNSPNKRVKEIIWPLYNNLVPYWGEDCIHFIGSEYPGFGVREGVVDDNKLNELYNRSLFTLISSKQEGLNLPMIEGIICNAKPVICNDMSTAKEFGIPEFSCNPNPKDMFYKIREISSRLEESDKICFEYAQKYSRQFSPEQVASNIINVYERI